MLSLFFVPEISDASTMVVEGDEAHHAIKVMRMEVGEELQLSDGRGNWVQGSITGIHKNSFTVSISNRGHTDRSHPEMVVVQALTKSDRAKETIELLVEGGVDRIIPWQSDHCIAKWKEDMHGKWESAAIASCKQSRRHTIPIIEQPTSLAKIRERFTSHSLLLVLHESAQQKLSVVVSPSAISFEEIVLVIGPEGGLSTDELRELEAIGGKVVRLGTPVLRSAHAGLAGLAAVAALIKHW
jgi:16S rRNA (uracil1498-N3)-methyltransferase